MSSAGIAPENWFPGKRSFSSSVQELKSEGSEPERAFFRRLRTRRWVKFPTELRGIWPESPAAGRRSAMTWPVVLPQVTPNQEQGVGWD